MTDLPTPHDPAALVCPECGSFAITVQATVWVMVDRDHEHDQAHGSGYEYDDASPAVCRGCEFRAQLLAFDPEPYPEPAEFPINVEALALSEPAPDAPEPIDMDAIVDLLRGAGVDAYVEQTGGGCATLFAGRIEHPSGYVPDGWIAAAGPGYFAGPGWTLPRGVLGDFWIGPNGDDTATPSAPTTTDPAEAAALVATVVCDYSTPTIPPIAAKERAQVMSHFEKGQP